MSNSTHVKIVLQGAHAIDAWREKHEYFVFDLKGANLERVDLSGADLSGAILEDANLTYADLSGSTFNETNLRGANLFSADLDRADFEHADLREAILEGASMEGTNFTQADLRGVGRFPTAEFVGAVALEFAFLDPGRFADIRAAGYVRMDDRPETS